jgi:hypothetical protein
MARLEVRCNDDMWNALFDISEHFATTLAEQTRLALHDYLIETWKGLPDTYKDDLPALRSYCEEQEKIHETIQATKA